ncbi:geminin [Nematostella vectensis]|uniref:geminin n=1 Tax=Nematostella vectensis TaxID=45351 RepID=UPI002076F3E2|nr:geminin [Nematostella vectensis]
MASPERGGSLSCWQKTPSKSLEVFEYHDENTPLSPGEVKTMRNQSKATTRLFTSSRKAKPFSVHGDSPQSLVKLTSGSDSQERRKTLQVLQPSASSKGVLVGSSVVRKEKLQGKEKKKSNAKQTKFKVHNSEEKSSTSSDSSDTESTKRSSSEQVTDDDKKSVSDEAFALMIQEPAPESYWQLLAEERRLALQETLEENQRLCKELEAMKERCSKLEEVAGQAEYFASLYSMVMEGGTAVLDSSDAESDGQDTKEESQDNTYQDDTNQESA